MKKLLHRIQTAVSKAWHSVKNTIKTHKKQTIAVIIVAIILLTPYTTGLKDGGTRMFLSLTYQITIHHAYADRDEIPFDTSPDLFYVRQGVTVCILLIPIYDHTYYVAYKDGKRVDMDLPGD